MANPTKQQLRTALQEVMQHGCCECMECVVRIRKLLSDNSSLGAPATPAQPAAAVTGSEGRGSGVASYFVDQKNRVIDRRTNGIIAQCACGVDAGTVAFSLNYTARRATESPDKTTAPQAPIAKATVSEPEQRGSPEETSENLLDDAGVPVCVDNPLLHSWSTRGRLGNPLPEQLCENGCGLMWKNRASVNGSAKP